MRTGCCNSTIRTIAGPGKRFMLMMLTNNRASNQKRSMNRRALTGTSGSTIPFLSLLGGVNVLPTIPASLPGVLRGRQPAASCHADDGWSSLADSFRRLSVSARACGKAKTRILAQVSSAFVYLAAAGQLHRSIWTCQMGSTA